MNIENFKKEPKFYFKRALNWQKKAINSFNNIYNPTRIQDFYNYYHLSITDIFIFYYLESNKQNDLLYKKPDGNKLKSFKMYDFCQLRLYFNFIYINSKKIENYQPLGN